MVTTFKAKGLIGDAHELVGGVLGRCGTPIASWFVNEPDLIVAWGASFSNHTGIAPDTPIVQDALVPTRRSWHLLAAHVVAEEERFRRVGHPGLEPTPQGFWTPADEPVGVEVVLDHLLVRTGPRPTIRGGTIPSCEERASPPGHSSPTPTPTPRCSPGSASAGMRCSTRRPEAAGDRGQPSRCWRRPSSPAPSAASIWPTASAGSTSVEEMTSELSPGASTSIVVWWRMLATGVSWLGGVSRVGQPAGLAPASARFRLRAGILRGRCYS